MKEIKLTKEQVTLVDDIDFERLAEHKWCVVKPRHKYYAMRNIYIKGISHCVYMHREILRPRLGMMVDHIDGDGLNNIRSNLRECTPRENACNRGKQSDNTSGFKGVYRASRSDTMISERKKPWVAYIKVPVNTRNKRLHLGYFATREEAALAYDAAARKYFGEFAKLNFPEIK